MTDVGLQYILPLVISTQLSLFYVLLPTF